MSANTPKYSEAPAGAPIYIEIDWSVPLAVMVNGPDPATVAAVSVIVPAELVGVVV